MQSIIERLEEWKKDIEQGWPTTTIIIGSDVLEYEQSLELLKLIELGIRAKNANLQSK